MSGLDTVGAIACMVGVVVGSVNAALSLRARNREAAIGWATSVTYALAALLEKIG